MSDARFSSDGAYIVSSCCDGTARICQTNAWWVYSLATQRVTRKLTLDERKQYGVSRKQTPEERIYYYKKADAP